MSRYISKEVLYVSLITTLLILSLVPTVGVTDSTEINVEKIREYLKDSVSTIKEYVREGKYVVLNNYFGQKVYVISTTLLDSRICEGSKDSDADGLCDDEEESLGTDPKKFDTDGDGLPDSFEAGYALYAFYNGLLDTGQGPLVILVFRVPKVEYSSIYGRTPYGMSEAERGGKKLFRGGILNPLKKDTDGDGLSDLYELVATHTLHELTRILYLYECNPEYSDIALIASAFRIRITSNYFKTNHYYCVFGGPVLNPFVGVTLSDLKRGKTIYGRVIVKHLGVYPVRSVAQAYYQLVLTAGRRWFNNQSLKYVPHISISNIKTDPTLPDTDGDGLSDYIEIYVSGTSPLIRDTDSDGLNDPMELSLGTNPLRPSTDGDRLSDYEEVRLGTSPFTKDTDGDGLYDDSELRLGTDPRSPDTDSDGLDDMNDYLRANPLKPDTDGDGANDFIEFVSHSDPHKVDTDGDGLSDYDELFKYHTSPVCTDTDRDGLSDYDEIKLGTDPGSSDTDGDGIDDGKELKNNLNPNKYDTDGDGLSDYYELYGISNSCLIYDYIKNKYIEKHITYTSDPHKVDSDGDGLTDYEEIQKCLNPLRSDTDGDGLVDPEDPYPYGRDADGDGLTDPEELMRGTNPFMKDTDGDGIPDPKDTTLDVSKSVIDSRVKEQEDKVVKEVKIRFKLSATSGNATEVKVKINEGDLRRAFKVLANFGLKELPKKDEKGHYVSTQVSIRIRLEPRLSVNDVKYVLKKAWVRGSNAKVFIEGDEVVLKLSYKYFYIDSILNKPINNGKFRDSVHVIMKFTNSKGNKSVIIAGTIKLVITDERPPEILGANAFWDAGSGRLYISVLRASKVVIRAPGLVLGNEKDRVVIEVPKDRYWRFMKSISLVPKGIVLGSKEEGKVFELPKIEFGEVEKGSGLAVMKVSVEAIEKGQEIGYYVAQLSMVKSFKAKIVYGALATYTAVETVVGGFKELIPEVEVGGGNEGGGSEGGGSSTSSTSSGGEGGKVKGLVNYLVDKIKGAAIDWVKEKLEKYARESELEARKEEVTYRIVITACNDFGCVNKSILVKGVGYG